MKNIAHLLDVVDEVRDHVALGLMSDPGLSKTSQVKQWAENNGRRYCELIISQRMPSEISGMPMPVHGTDGEQGKMEIFDFDTLLTLEDGDVLAFDEFTNGNIQTLNACLTLIQERTMLSGRKLPSLVIVAMGNPQGRCDLLPQTKQRFLWVDVAWDGPTWVNYMERAWGVTPHSKLIQHISTQYRVGFNDSGAFNYLTPRTVENMYRVSLKVDREDVFWECTGFDHDFIDALYATQKGVDRFRVIQKQLIDWVSDLVAEPGTYRWAGDIMASVGSCNTMEELRDLIHAIERENSAPEFIAYIQSSESVPANE